jgi:hypothetical protein
MEAMLFCMYVIVAYSYIPVIINQVPFSRKKLDENLSLNSIKILHIFSLNLQFIPVRYILRGLQFYF